MNTMLKYYGFGIFFLVPIFSFLQKIGIPKNSAITLALCLSLLIGFSQSVWMRKREDIYLAYKQIFVSNAVGLSFTNNIPVVIKFLDANSNTQYLAYYADGDNSSDTYIAFPIVDKELIAFENFECELDVLLDTKIKSDIILIKLEISQKFTGKIITSKISLPLPKKYAPPSNRYIIP